MKKQILLGAFLFYTASSFAQIIEWNNVRAHIGNIPGRIFQYSIGPNQAGYEVPKNSNQTAIYATSLWCAALDDTGGLHLAAMRFGQNGYDFFKGPYSSTNAYQTPAYSSVYGSSIWYVSLSQIQFHIANYQQSGYIMNPNIANWPGNGITGVGVASNLAPFVDNNNNGIYEPILGEYPDIRGDECIYMIMNDTKANHGETGGQALGIEVHTMVYQYATSDYRNNTTFLNYRIFNRGVNNYNNFKVSLWSDFDLGGSMDDYLGCDVTNKMMYVYNADNNDLGGFSYGTNPPAVGISCLNRELSGFSTFTNGSGSPYTDPSTAAQYFNFMQSLWGDGSSIYFGGNGTIGSIPTKFMFPGDSDPTFSGTGGIDPGALWDEISAGNAPGDRRGVMTVEDVALPAGAQECYDFAVLYSRESGNDHLQNINSLRSTAALAKTDYDQMNAFNCNQVTLSTEEAFDTELAIYPNPTDGILNVDFGGAALTGKIQILNLAGQVVLEQGFESTSSFQIEVEETPGVYLLMIITDQGTLNRKLVIR